jgi:hypothetical protein
MAGRAPTYIGIDLGGARGKTTAVARLSMLGDQAIVEEVCRQHDNQPFRDPVVLDYLAGIDSAVVAVNAPLTSPACLRCQLAACPGREACVDPAVIWLRTVGEVASAKCAEARAGQVATTRRSYASTAPLQNISPYLHRCSEVDLHYRRQLMGRDALNKATSPVAARASHLRRQLVARGWRLNHDLLEVAPRLTVQALFGAELARGYKRDADPWETRAAILAAMTDLRFASTSRFAREEALRNDHCFEAVLSGYTAYLRSRDGWTMPDPELHDVDGWIWAPPE